jgi:hypothetical protein
MRQPEGIEIAGQPPHAYPTASEAIPPATVAVVVNRTA